MWSFSFRLSNLFSRRNAVISNVTNTCVVDMDSAITTLDPDTSQFETILQKLSKVSPVRVSWLEDNLMPRLQWRFDDPRDDFHFPSTWEDCPRKPQVHLTLTSAEKYPYGTIVRRQTGTEGNTLRFIGGDTWEVIA